MKSLVPLVLLVGMFAAGCATPEDNFMAGAPLVAAPQSSMPAETNTMTIAPALTLPSDPEPAATKSADTTVVALAVKKTKTKKTIAPKSVAAPAARATPALQIIITPDNSLAGKVLAYNSPGHFVVLDFPAGPMPKMDQTLFVYRAGLKVAEVKITGPQRDNDTVADIINGDAQAGDEVRDQ